MTAKYKVRLDRSLSIDFELTCWEKDDPKAGTPEIIQIGIAELDFETFGRIRSDSWYVKNEFGDISDYCTSITGITQRILDRQGMPLADVARIVAKKYGSRNKSWFAWGSDKAAHDIDCQRKSVEPFLSNAFFNVGLFYSQLAAESRSLGLDEVAERLDIAFEGRPHDAKTDAEVLCDIWAKLSMQFANVSNTPKSVVISPN